MAEVVEAILASEKATEGLIDAPMTLDNVQQTDHLARQWVDDAVVERAG